MTTTAYAYCSGLNPWPSREFPRICGLGFITVWIPYTIGMSEEDPSSPEPSQLPYISQKECLSPPQTSEPEPATMPVPEPNIVPEHNGISDQVREPAISSVPKGVLVEYEGMELSHTPEAAVNARDAPL